jgi:hypothetical protein
MRNAYRISVKNLNGRGHLGELVINGRIILKLILQKLAVRV